MSASILIERVVDNRKYEQIQANAGARVYERAASCEWGYRYKYLTTYSWGKKFNEPFLDFGCGTGLASSVLEKLGRQVVAFDISRGMLSFARKRCSVSLVLADALNLPFKDKVFSTTCVTGVLHHILDLEKVFAEIGRCTRETICINEPSLKPSIVMRMILFMVYCFSTVRRKIMQLGKKRSTSNLKTERYHSRFERPLDPKGIVQLCAANGFKVVQLRYYNHIPLLHEFLGENVRRRLFTSLVSSKNGTDAEIIATADNWKNY